MLYVGMWSNVLQHSCIRIPPNTGAFLLIIFDMHLTELILILKAMLRRLLRG